MHLEIANSFAYAYTISWLCTKLVTRHCQSASCLALVLSQVSSFPFNQEVFYGFPGRQQLIGASYGIWIEQDGV